MGSLEIIKGMGFIEVVDESDKIIGYQSPKTIEKNRLRHRSAYILITDLDIHDKRHKLLISYSYDKFDLPSGGRLNFNESYEIGAQRHIRESLGIGVSNLTNILSYCCNNLPENSHLFHLKTDRYFKDTKSKSFIWISPSQLILDLIRYPNYSTQLYNAFRYVYKNWSTINSSFNLQ